MDRIDVRGINIGLLPIIFLQILCIVVDELVGLIGSISGNGNACMFRVENIFKFLCFVQFFKRRGDGSKISHKLIYCFFQIRVFVRGLFCFQNCPKFYFRIPKRFILHIKIFNIRFLFFCLLSCVVLCFVVASVCLILPLFFLTILYVMKLD